MAPLSNVFNGTYCGNGIMRNSDTSISQDNTSDTSYQNLTDEFEMNDLLMEFQSNDINLFDDMIDLNDYKTSNDVNQFNLFNCAEIKQEALFNIDENNNQNFNNNNNNILVNTNMTKSQLQMQAPTQQQQLQKSIKQEPMNTSINRKELRYGPLVVRPRKNPAPTLSSGRKSKYIELTPEEESKRHVRRQRNRVAAEKCKLKRLQIEENLENTVRKLEDDSSNLLKNLNNLKNQKLMLEKLLNEHCCQMYKSNNNIQQQQQQQQIQYQPQAQYAFQSQYQYYNPTN